MKVSLGIVHGDKIDAWFFHTVLSALTSTHTDIHLADHICVRSGPLLSQGRGQLVGSFLEHTDSDALLMIDADQFATPDVLYGHIDAFKRLRADDPTVGILAGITYIAKDPQYADILYPNIWVANQKGYPVQLTTYPKDSLIEILRAGASNMLIAREVLQYFADKNINPFHHMSVLDYPTLVSGIQPYGDDPAKQAEILKALVEDADQLGEDLSFCDRVREAGYRILCHTGIIYEHSKSILLNEAMYDAAVLRHTTQAPGVPEPTE